MTRFGWCGGFVLLALVATGAEAQRGFSAEERQLLERLALAEARGEGELGMALVTRSVLNRAALVGSRSITPGTYNARGRSLRSIVYARGQYQPVSSGQINARRTSNQRAQARRAVLLGFDTARLNQALAQAGVSSGERRLLINSTGFRAGTAFNDSSQNYGRVVFRRHIFNTDRFAQRQNVMQIYQRYYGTAPTNLADSTIPIPTPRPTRPGDAAAQQPPQTPAPSATEPRQPLAQLPRERPAGPPVGMRRGARGDDVRVLQSALNARGARLKVDGDFGRRTQNALRAFQRANRLRQTGTLTQETLRRLVLRPPVPTPRPTR